MGTTADLTIVQKTVIDNLSNKEVKPLKVIARDAGCSQSAVSKHTHRKLSGWRESVVKKGAQETGITASPERTVK